MISNGFRQALLNVSKLFPRVISMDMTMDELVKFLTHDANENTLRSLKNLLYQQKILMFKMDQARKDEQASFYCQWQDLFIMNNFQGLPEG